MLYRGIFLGALALAAATAAEAQFPRPGLTPLQPAAGASAATAGADATKEMPKLDTRLPGASLPPAMKPQGTNAADFAKLLVHKGMVRISAGKNEGKDLDDDLGPYVILVRDPFHMDRTEVTWKLWKEVRDWAAARVDKQEADRAFFKYDIGNAGAGKGDDHPVQLVSWYECVKWCNARSEKEGLTPCYTVGGSVFRSGDGSPDCDFSASGYRLPTVQEWEYAARGGLTDTRFPWGNEITQEQANYFSVEGMEYDTSATHGLHEKYKTGEPPFTSPVASFAPNGYGLYDMAGNVCEWCWAAKGSSRYICGGSWDADASGLRCGARSVCDGPSARGDYCGFRTVRRAGQ
jgi:formylglycine-generating enzyme required for sulfatase activity